jgi:hypothetical protein
MSNQKCATEAMQRKYSAIRKQNREIGRNKLSHANLDFVVGCVLYWAEGTKSRKMIDFTNCDSAMVKKFISFLRNNFEIDEARFRVRVTYHKGASLESIEEFWSRELGVPRSQFNKATVREPSSAATKHTNGIVKVTYNDVSICQQLLGAIESYIGEERSSWH